MKGSDWKAGGGIAGLTFKYVASGRPVPTDVSLIPSATFPGLPDAVSPHPSRLLLTTRPRIMAVAAPAPFSRLQLAAALLGTPANAHISLGILTSLRV